MNVNTLAKIHVAALASGFTQLPDTTRPIYSKTHQDFVTGTLSGGKHIGDDIIRHYIHPNGTLLNITPDAWYLHCMAGAINENGKEDKKAVRVLAQSSKVGIPAVVYNRMHTPWGSADFAKVMADGIGIVGTPSHGGIKLSDYRNLQIPEVFRRSDAWYEEDCDIAIPLHFLAEYLPAEETNDPQYKPLEVLKTWHWEAYEKHFGVTLQPKESFLKDEKLWLEANKDKWIGVAAIGNGSYPYATVTVTACIGGRGKNGMYASKTEEFIVPTAEYDARMDNPGHAFIVDPARHPRVSAAA